MCSTHPPKSATSWTGEKKYRLADFFDQWWDIYKQSPTEKITAEQYKAVNAIRVCRTEALGVDYYACHDCGEITKVYHSCKNRFCPTCSWQDTTKWADRIKNQMMDLPHRHVVITLPHLLNNLIKANGKYLLDILFRTASGILKDWILKRYGIKSGIISVLHTFGETKGYHVHVHVIVSWGGIKATTGALKSIESDYVNYDFLKKKFRIKFEDELVKMYEDNTLVHGFDDDRAFFGFIKQLNKKKWILHLEPAMEVPTQVIRYIGRYSKRACLSEYKLTKMEGEVIAFRYKDNKDLDKRGKPKEQEKEFHYKDFFPRLLQHVPLKYFRLVRYYGMYSNRSQIPEEYLYKESDNTEINEQERWEELQEEKTGINPMLCKHCDTVKIYLYTIFRKRDGKFIKINRKEISIIKKQEALKVA
ncbi:MAG: transposase [Bacteroidales bacterium]|jgi:hypothetical protein|nr:transposase [Bacteroidales bacterium]